MVEKINFNPNIIQHSVKETENAPVTQQSFEGSNEISPKVSNAYRAYGQAMLQKPLEQLSLNNCILQLQKQGKIEGKDYCIKGCTMGNLVLYVNNKDGQEEKVLHFDQGNIEKCSCWEEYKYANGKKIKGISHDMNGKIHNYQDYYYNDEISQEAFTKEHITAETTPKEYIQYLKENNKKFEVENIKNDGFQAIRITEFDEYGKEIQYTSFETNKENFAPDYCIIMREEYLPNGNRKRIEFSKTDTYITNYSYD